MLKLNEDWKFNAVRLYKLIQQKMDALERNFHFKQFQWKNFTAFESLKNKDIKSILKMIEEPIYASSKS